MRAALSRLFRSVFAVVGAPDAETERRSRLLLIMAAALVVLLGLSFWLAPQSSESA